MEKIIISTIIAFFVCNQFTHCLSNEVLNKQDNNNTNVCSDQNDCLSCVEIKGCASWYCLPPNGELSEHYYCQNTSNPKPNSSCQGKWHKIQSHDMCNSIQSMHSINATIDDSKMSKKKQSISYSKTLINDDDCSAYKDCITCFGDTQCAFWWCDVEKVWTGDMVCEKPKDPKPKTPCEGKWRKLERPDTCDSIHKKNTTTTTTSTTTSTTSTTPSTTTTTTGKTTTTNSPETTTNKNTTTTTNSPKTTKTTTPEPHHESEGKLTGGTIAGIVISSVVVVAILVGVSYKKVMKIYRARNPYHTLND